MSIPNNTVRTVRLGGLQTAVISRSELADIMVQDCLAARAESAGWVPRTVFSSNGQGIALAGRDSGFQATMNAADVIHADGMPVVLASRLTGRMLPERIATTDFFHDAALAASAAGLRFFMLGGSDELNSRAVDEIRRRYPELLIVGRRNGYFAESEESVIADILNARPDVVWVGLGKPLQEEWCVRNRDRLTGIGWLKTCGGLYSFLAGDAPRAPRWMQRSGLEWLYRMCKEPTRLGPRYLATNPYAFYRLMRYSDRPKRSGL